MPPTGLELPDPEDMAGLEEVIDIAALHSDPQNARRHTKRNLDTLEKSIEEVGLWRSIAIDEDNVIYAGNATVEVAGQMGFGKVRVVEAGPDEIVAVRRRGLTAEQKRRYGMFDNRAAELAEWDEDQLAAFHEAGTSFADIFSQNELAQLLSQATLPMEELQTIDDRPVVIPTTPISKPGDIWVLGRHLLICGDSRDAKVVKALLGEEVGTVDLVFTDPPYNVRYVGKTEEKLEIQNDRMSDEEFLEFLNQSFNAMWEVLKPGGVYYVCHPGGPLAELFMRSLRECKLALRQQIIWAKNSLVMGHSDFHYKHEPIAFGWKEGAHYSCGDRSLTTLWEIDRPSASRDHPTMKPIKLITDAITYSSRPDDLVYDPFGGSGTTLLGCEMMDRKCRMAEIDPVYCDVIVKRWSELTQLEPKLYSALSKEPDQSP